MATEYTIKAPGHPSIYTDQPIPREYNIYFCEPEAGITSNTGILLLIPGFGANSQSKVYKKMRSVFADTYDLVTIQCDYFGSQYMQNGLMGNVSFNIGQLKTMFTDEQVKTIFSNHAQIINQLFHIGSKYQQTIQFLCQPRETRDSFADMGLMQALDNLTAVYYVKAILEDNGHKINPNRVIAYGHSQGAYLCYMCNALAPQLISLIIDNSAWLFPLYLNSFRWINQAKERLTVQIVYDYLARRLEDYDQHIVSLPLVYQQFKNSAEIIAFHGKSDRLIGIEDKQSFCSSISNCHLHKISSQEVDNIVFKSHDHGLGADFIKLFARALSDFQPTYYKEFFGISENIQYRSPKFIYTISFHKGIPILSRAPY